MKNQSVKKFATRTALAGAVALCSAPLLAVADTGSDAFDRQTQLLGQNLRNAEIVINTTPTPAPRRLGAEGRPGEAISERAPPTDTGSRWFDSYVEQVNRQLQARTEFGGR